MKMQYFKQYSTALGRDMECKLYGHCGRPVIYIPCQDGRFFDFEDFHMADTWRPFIDAGQVMVLSIDTLDAETWSNKGGDPGWRSYRHEQWMAYIMDEVVPFIQGIAQCCNGRSERDRVIVFGCSLGATHAVNLFLRRPDLFDGLLALSGIYTADYGFDGYMDERVYLNSPVHYVPNMSNDHPYIQMYRERRGIVCVGQGDWELPNETRTLQAVLEGKGISLWFDYWGFDVSHDWPWWHRQVLYFLPHLLEA